MPLYTLARTSTQGVSLFPRLLSLRALAKLADIMEPIGRQEETELPAQILAEFVMVCAGLATGGSPGSSGWGVVGGGDGEHTGRHSQPTRAHR